MSKSKVELRDRVIAMRRKYGENAYPYAALKQFQAAANVDVDGANMWSEVLDNLDGVGSSRSV